MRKIFSLKMLVVLVLGFASGLPLALTGQSLQAWLTAEKVDMATIGFFSLVGIPYTFKFLWAPLMDRFELPWFGRRKGWLVLTQGSLAVVLYFLSLISPTTNTETFAMMALLVAFVSASQDIVVDAYRTDVMDQEERGLGSSLYVFGYRLAMIVSSGIAFVWADPVSGNGWSWNFIYQIMALFMVGAMFVSFFLLPKVASHLAPPSSSAKNDLIGFFSLVVVAFVGYKVTTEVLAPILINFIGSDESSKKWADMLSLLFGISLTLPLGWFVAQKAKFETFNRSLENYFKMPGALAFLGFIILYKLGDAFAGSLLTPFLLKGVGFSSAEVGVANKVIGMWLTIFGAIAGGALMIRLNLFRALMLFGVLQLLSNFGFWTVAVLGKGAWGGFTIPAFDLIFVTLKEPTQIDSLLILAIAFENLTGGMGTAAFVALLMALCNQKFTATHYALLSAFSSVGRVWVGPLAGTLTTIIGWPTFFILSIFMAIPGLVMLTFLREKIRILEAPAGVSLVDD